MRVLNSVKQVLNSVKQGPELSKTSHKPVINQSYGRVNLNNGYNQSGTLNTGCVLLPLGSPTRSQKQLLVHRAGRGRWWRQVGSTGGVWGLGGYRGG